MKSKPNPSPAAAELRRCAEARLRERQEKRRPASGSQRSEADTQRLVHELEVHQIELEIQNEELSRANVQAEASARKFSDLYDFAPIGYVSLDERSRIQDLNFTAAKLLRRSRSVLAGTLFVSSVVRRDQETFLRHLQTASETEAQVTAEVELWAESGLVVPVQLGTIYRREESGQPPHYLTAITDFTDRKQAEEAIRHLNTQLALAEQRERSRLAEVLHEHLLQLLVGAKYLLSSAHQDSTGEGETMLARAEQILSQSVAVARSLSGELSPPILFKEGLATALTWLAHWMREKHDLTVLVEIGAEQAPLSEEVSVLLYQSVKELLVNVVKHAEVKSAGVATDWVDGQVRIVVSDEGKGLDPARLLEIALAADKFGLLSVRERLALLGGQMEIDSAPGRGSRFTLRVPLGQPLPGQPKGKKGKNS